MDTIRKYKVSWAFASVAMSFFSVLYVLVNCREPSYSSLWILPLSFMISSPFLIRGLLKFSFSPFVIVFYAINAVRFVILPLLMVWKNYYSYKSPVPPDATALLIAEVIMSYELFVICLYLNLRKIATPRSEPSNNTVGVSSLVQSHNKDVYYLFILLCVAIYITVPAVRENISIVLPKDVNSSEITPFTLLLILTVILGKNILFVLLLQRLYERNVKGLTLFVALLILMLANSSVYYGLNRSDFLLSFIACSYTVGRLYPKVVKKVLLFLIPVGVVIFSMITTLRNYYHATDDPIIEFISTCHGYCGSVYNVGISVEAAKAYPEHRNLLVFINDFLRPSLGFNMLMKPLNLPLSNDLFNARMYMQTDHITQIMPMIGQGYFLFGAFFCPVIDLIFLEIANRLIKLLNKGDIEKTFFLTITCTRLGFMVAQNSQIQMNDLSFNLFLFFILYYINKKVTFRNKQAKYE